MHLVQSLPVYVLGVYVVYAGQHLISELQKIYLFAPEGCSQDRGRPRPPPTSAGSPAKRAKLDDEQEEEQQTVTEEIEQEQHQKPEDTEANDTAAERSSTSKPVVSLCTA